MTFLAMLLLGLALGAGLLGALQQARELRRLRDDLDALARPRLIDAHDATSAGPSRMFSSLYEESPGALEGLKRLPGVGGLSLAAVLGLVGVSFVLLVASKRSGEAEAAEVAAAVTVDSLALLRTSRDSLAAVVTRLRDSMDLEQRKSAEAAAPARRPPARRASPVARAPRPSQVSPAPVLPPAPQLGSGAATP
jgi:hypothetical protein